MISSNPCSGIAQLLQYHHQTHCPCSSLSPLPFRVPLSVGLQNPPCHCLQTGCLIVNSPLPFGSHCSLIYQLDQNRHRQISFQNLSLPFLFARLILFCLSCSA